MDIVTILWDVIVSFLLIVIDFAFGVFPYAEVSVSSPSGYFFGARYVT